MLAKHEAVWAGEVIVGREVGQVDRAGASVLCPCPEPTSISQRHRSRPVKQPGISVSARLVDCSGRFAAWQVDVKTGAELVRVELDVAAHFFHQKIDDAQALYALLVNHLA